MADKDLAILKKAFETLNDKYDSIDKNVHFTLMAKDDFKNKVLKPLLIKNDQIADTSELFLRSCQLLEAAGMELDTTLTKDFLNDIEPISDIAWNYMVPILEKMKSKDITLLTKKGQLGISGWAVLSKKRNARRYYATPIIIEKEQYYLTNHWSDQNKDVLIQWILDHSK